MIRMGKLHARLGNGCVLLVVSSLALGAVVGCDNKEDEKPKAVETKEKKPPADPYADGKKLEGELKEWQKRWSEFDELPSCEPLLTEAVEIEACKTAATSLVTLKAAVAKREPIPVLIHAAGELALATENALEFLRAAMEKKQAATAAGDTKTEATAKPTPKPGPKPDVKPSPVVPTAADAKKEAAPEDTAMLAMRGFSRINRAALRFMGRTLQFGPLPTRKMAFAELEKLSQAKKSWPVLGRTLADAARTETDPNLSKQLKALAPRLSRRTPGEPEGMMGGRPPGHPGQPRPRPPGMTPPAPTPPAPAPAAPPAAQTPAPTK